MVGTKLDGVEVLGVTKVEPSELAQRWVVHGRVQGVGFRFFTRRAAVDLRLCGRVRNLADGTVEVLVRGERAAVDLLEDAVRRGPTHSRVVRVEVSSWDGSADWDDFEIDGF